MAQVLNLRNAIQNLEMFANDIEYDATSVEAQNIFINNYQAAATDPQFGWRPMQGANLADSLYIIMDRMDQMYTELESVRNENMDLTTRLSEIENNFNDLDREYRESELGLSA